MYNNNYMRKRADESFGAAFKPGVANVTTGLVTGIIGGYLGNRYAGTKGMIAGGIGGGALGYTGASAVKGLINHLGSDKSGEKIKPYTPEERINRADQDLDVLGWAKDEWSRDGKFSPLTEQQLQERGYNVKKLNERPDMLENYMQLLRVDRFNAKQEALNEELRQNQEYNEIAQLLNAGSVEVDDSLTDEMLEMGIAKADALRQGRAASKLSTSERVPNDREMAANYSARERARLGRGPALTKAEQRKQERDNIDADLGFNFEDTNSGNAPDYQHR